MLPARKAIDGLWHNLYPSLSSATCALILTVPKRQLQAPTPCLQFRPRSDIQNAVQTPRGALRYGTQNQSTVHRRYVDQEFVPSAGDIRDQGLMRTLDIYHVYQKLRQIALGGIYHQIQACVNILVKERGEKPNTRLYEALLLANADHEHGSASDAASLLEEMNEEGITLDSATYHVVLRVPYLMRSPFFCPGLTSCRFLLCTQTTCYGTT